MQERSHADANIEPAIEALEPLQMRFGRFSIRRLRVSHGAFLLGEHLFCRNELAKILVAHFQGAALNLALEIVHWPRRRTGDTRTIEREDGSVAWTNELLLRFHPRNRTTQVRTDR